jgi:hypothetical protein
MKSLLIALFFAVGVMANEHSDFEILPGKLHKGGSLLAKAQTMNEDYVHIHLNYEIFKKGLVPVPSEYLKGIYKQKLPAIFLDERGYLELEQLKSMKIEEATVYYKGRTKYRDLHDAHLIQILPDNKKSEIFLVYHPQAPGLGWDNIKVILHTGVPLLENYMLEGKSKKF